FFLSTMSVQAQKKSPEEISREMCYEITNEAIEDLNSKKYAEALEKLLKVESIASENLWHDQLWRIKNNIGIVYARVSSLGEALECYEESYSITQKFDSLKVKGSILLTNIAVLFAKEKNYEEALIYIHKAYNIFVETGGKTDEKKNTANNLAGIYIELGDSQKSFVVLNEVKDLVENVKIDFLWEALYIKTLLIDG